MQTKPAAQAVPPSPHPRFSRTAERRRRSDHAAWIRRGLIVTGCLLVALCFNTLLRPHGVSGGGVIGVSVILQQLLGWEPALAQWVLNLGLLLPCWPLLGRRFVVNSLGAILLIPLFVYLTRNLPVPSANPLLSTLVGATGIGAGLGLVFRAGASVGGFTAVALACHHRWGWSVARGLLTLDALAMALGLFVLQGEQWLASLVAIFLVGRTARAVMTGLNRSLVATIISRKSGEIRPAILRQLSLGLTVLEGRGGYTTERRDVLLVVLAPAELVGLKQTVQTIDPDAFVVVSDATEVLGHGFTIPVKTTS